MTLMCRMYGVTRAGFYQWQARGASHRERQDAQLLDSIRDIHAESRQTYGSPRVHQTLRQAGTRVGKKRVERLMRQHQIKARAARLYRNSRKLDSFFASVPNQQLKTLADRPDRVWVGDVTYLRVGGVWRYLATVMDKYSRRIIGWALSKYKNVGLTLKALDRAVFRRRARPGVIFHSDRGVEYASYTFRDRLNELGFVQSMNRPGTMTDNAHMESFFHSMKSDVIHGVTFNSDAELQTVVRRYIPFYNQRRIHSSLGYCSPLQFEQRGA